MKFEYKLTELESIAHQVIENASNKVILFYGEMGVGKTTLIKELCKVLGVTDVISSPTFSIVNEYEADSSLIYHFDFYRINDEEEAYSIGFEEYVYSDHWVFIEWPEKIKNLLPDKSQIVRIKNLENGSRELIMES